MSVTNVKKKSFGLEHEQPSLQNLLDFDIDSG